MVGKSGTMKPAASLAELPPRPTTKDEYEAFLGANGNMRMTDTQMSHCFRITIDTITQAVSDIVKIVNETPGLEAILLDKTKSKGLIASEHKRVLRRSFDQLQQYRHIFGDRQPETFITEKHKSQAFARLMVRVVAELKKDFTSTDAAYRKEEVASKPEDDIKQRIPLNAAVEDELGNVQSITDNKTATPSPIAMPKLPSALQAPSHSTTEHTPGRLLALFNATPTEKLEVLTDVCIRLLDRNSGRTITKVTTDFFCREPEGTGSECDNGREVFPEHIRLDLVNEYIAPYLVRKDELSMASEDLQIDVQLYHGQMLINDDDALEAALLRFERGPRASCEFILQVHRRGQTLQSEDVEMADAPLAESPSVMTAQDLDKEKQSQTLQGSAMKASTPTNKRRGKVAFSDALDVVNESPTKKLRRSGIQPSRGLINPSKTPRSTETGAGGVGVAPVRRTPRKTRRVVRGSMASQGEMEGEELDPFADARESEVSDFELGGPSSSSTPGPSEDD